MTMVTNLRHFLDENGEVPDLTPEAEVLLAFLGQVVEAATLSYDKPISLAGELCRAVLKGDPCRGEVEVWVYAENNQIGWECLECGDDGVITNWEGTKWDCRDYTCH